MKNLVLKSIVSVVMVLGLSNANANITISGKVTDQLSGLAIPGANVLEKGTSNSTVTDVNGSYSIVVTSEYAILSFSCLGYQLKEVKIKGRKVINIKLSPDEKTLEDSDITTGQLKKDERKVTPLPKHRMDGTKEAYVISECEMLPTVHNILAGSAVVGYAANAEPGYIQHNTEGYSTIHENGFKKVSLNPLSTFSIDVDAASYANMRRFINNGQKPPIDAVRIEEMINYFNYDYPQPKNEHPFTVNYELGECPWNKDNKLLHIGIQGKEIATENLPASNLVFLIDVSGSMSSYNKLPLLKKAFKLLVNELRPKDRVAIVVYAGASGVVLPSTPGNQKSTIIAALDRLQSGGSTAGAAGLQLAYKVAEENFMDEGNNRIILATDGDFNVGISSNAEMERLIEKEREKGISISVLGFGMGNYKDDKMEIIADKGNGNYAYIDNIQEANKVFVNEFGGTLFTIAKDVKIQLEFNPVIVKEYRLVGYENRLLNEEDFKNDKIDAGELGSGHTVTALYEIVLTNSTKEDNNMLKYQGRTTYELAHTSNELLTIKLRYKKPDGFNSKLIEKVVYNKPLPLSEASNNFLFSAAVAEFGMHLRNSEHKGSTSINHILELAKSSQGKDKNGYRGEFIQLVKASEIL